MSDAHRDEIKKLEALYAEHPEGRIFTHLAEAYRKAGELERARSVLEGGLERHSEYSSAHVVLGRVLMDQGHSAEAETEFQRVLELDAHNMVALRSLGDLARSDGRSAAALDHYQRLLEVEPSDQEVRAIVEELGSPGAASAAEPADADGATVGDQDFSAPADHPETGDDALVGGSSFEDAAWAFSESPEDAADVELDEPGEDVAPWQSSVEPEADQPPAPWVGDELGDEVEPGEPAEAAAGNGEWDPGRELEADGGGEPVAEPELPELPEPAGAGTEGWVADQDEDRNEDPLQDVTVDESPVSGDAEPVTAGEGDVADLDDLMADDSGTSVWDLDEDASAGLTEPEPDEEEDAPVSGSPGVMTETIAQVYARQGLYDRAAEVYRELVRERPQDSALRDRLTEMEELAAEASSEPPAAAGSTRDEDDTVDPWSSAAEGGEREAELGGAGTMEGLESSELDVAGAEAQPLEGLESHDVDPETHLTQETGGAGGNVDMPDDVDVRDVPGPPEEEPWSSEGEQWAPAASDEEPWSTVPEESDPWAASEGVAEGAEADEDEPSPSEREEPEDGSVWTGAEWGDAGADSPYAWAEPDEAEPAEEGPAIQSYFQGLLGWSGGPDQGLDPAADDGAPGAGAGAVGAAGGIETGQTGGAADAGAGTDGPRQPVAGSEREEDDDDLEMFRSWLESLKQ